MKLRERIIKGLYPSGKNHSYKVVDRIVKELKEPEVIDGITYHLKLVPEIYGFELPDWVIHDIIKDTYKRARQDTIEAINSQIKELA